MQSKLSRIDSAKEMKDRLSLGSAPPSRPHSFAFLISFTTLAQALT